MRRIFLSVILSIPLNFVFTCYILAWDNNVTHRDISKFAAENSVLSKNKGDYLKNLGFNKELLKEFKLGAKKRTVRDWLREGAFLEDAGSDWDAIVGKSRFNNHFHNPLKSWGEAGLSDIQSGEPSVLWAQDSAKQSNSIGGDWSWQAIREYFYKALTLKTDAVRQVNFAQTFQGLGYQVHLIQDMSVPAHVRNDAHPEDAILGKNYWTGDYYFETWAKANWSPESMEA